MRRFISFLALSLLAARLAAEEPVSIGRWNGLALNGYDSTSYQDLRSQNESRRAAPRPLAGAKKFQMEYKGATWIFASAEDLERFRAAPEQYRPEFNGFCANALSVGEGLVRTNGKVWNFFDDKLYLFYAENGRRNWLANWETLRPKAEAAWQKILKEQ